MRALLIGLGGAGCRIVETLNDHDERSNVKSVRSYAFDADTDLIHSMKSLDVSRRIALSPSDPTKREYEGGDDFDLSGVSDCFHEDGYGDIDGFFICAGLGGRMADLLPRFIAELETVFPDPVFSILTLPRRSEGVKVSTRASEQLAAVRALGSSCIIFDNETWAGRIEAAEAATAAELKDGETPAAPTHRKSAEMYAELNELLARRVGLLLRAGEVTHNGVESAEVVLDAGEVLNTLTGMDVVSIGYATEKLPKNMTGMFKRFFVEKYMLDEGHQRTSRIIDLAKKAVYEEVSVPCDLTSAEKALVLIAGPSEELSMKGFQMVRKWIDNSIRGLEMRAGDYPVKSTKYVGVIIVLAGIQNVPRIAELDEIRDSYYQEMDKVYEGFEVEEEDIPRLTVASDDSIFEPGEVLPPGDYVYALPELVYEDDPMDEIKEIEEIAELTDDDEELTTAYTDETSSDDDIFEDDPVVIKKSSPVYEQPVSTSVPYHPPVQQRVHDPQISIVGAKKAEKVHTSGIPLPKREKREDTVLAGMANLGEKNMPKDSERAVRVGGTLRPKDVEKDVRVGGRQRPKDSDAPVRIGGQLRPKDNDDVKIAKVQHPKDSDAPVRVGGQLRPKDTDDVKIAKVQHPNDSDAPVRLGSRQKTREGDGPVRIAQVNLPKDYREKAKLAAKRRSNEEDTHKKSEYRWL